MTRHLVIHILAIAFAISLAGCKNGSPTIPATDVPTDTPLPTVVVRVTTPPTNTPVPPTLTVTPSPSVPTASPTPTCTTGAAFIADVTIPDGTVLAPNTSFVKTWRIRNAGTCDWGPGLTLVFVGGTQLGGPTTLAFPPTNAGAMRDISLNLKAPAEAGTYEGKWYLRDAEGERLTAVTVSIVVPATPTPTPPPSATPKPTAIPTYDGTLESFLGDWRIVDTDFAGNSTDKQRLFKIKISNSGSNLLITPIDLVPPVSPYTFAYSGQVSAPYNGGRVVQFEFHDPARGHVTLKMSINKACNAWVNLTYSGFSGKFLVQNEAEDPPVSCK
jgi:hypothetical protein